LELCRTFMAVPPIGQLTRYGQIGDSVTAYGRSST